MNIDFVPGLVLSAAKMNKTQSSGEDVYVNDDDTTVWGEPMEASEDSSLGYDHQLYSLVFLRTNPLENCIEMVDTTYSDG